MTQTTDMAPGAVARDAKPQAADVLVVFGITGDLAKVMTFARSTGSRSAACSTARSWASPSTTGPTTS